MSSGISSYASLSLSLTYRVISTYGEGGGVAITSMLMVSCFSSTNEASTVMSVHPLDSKDFAYPNAKFFSMMFILYHCRFIFYFSAFFAHITRKMLQNSILIFF
jgi:hypothetical protein